MTKAAAPRQNHLAAIHMAQKALGLTNEDAAALKLAVTGQSSSKDMTAQQRARYLAHLSNLQGRMAPAPKRSVAARSPDDAQDARWRKARAIWHELAVLGVVHTDTDTSLMHYVMRQTKLSAWRFLNGYQVNSVIEALKNWQARVMQPTQSAEQEAPHAG